MITFVDMTREDSPYERPCWWAARTRNGQELSIRKTLAELGVDHFIPTREVIREKGGHRQAVEAPAVPCLIFLRATKTEALSLANGRGLPIWYMIDRSTRTLLTVPDKQMDDFRRVIETDPDALCPAGTEFAPGDRVRVVKGELTGIEGEILQEPRRTYVTISLGRLLCAKVQIRKSWLKLVEHKTH